MSSQLHRSYSPMILKLESIFALTEDERQALLALPMQIRSIKEGHDIVREGDVPSRSCAILSGFTCTYKMTGDGKRQIVAFGVAGDIPDLQSLHLKVLDISLAAITPCSVRFMTHEDLWDLCVRHPRIAAALWRETLVEGAIFREWMINVGRRDARSRLAHIVCEVLMRLRAVGLAENGTCTMPITQVEFADALGISHVHINRVLQELRGTGLIEMKGDQLKVPDWEALKQIADFDATYLHLLHKRPAA